MGNTTLNGWGRLARELRWDIDVEVAVLVDLARSPDPATSLRGLRAIRRVIGQVTDPAVQEALAERLATERAVEGQGTPYREGPSARRELDEQTN